MEVEKKSEDAITNGVPAQPPVLQLNSQLSPSPVDNGKVDEKNSDSDLKAPDDGKNDQISRDPSAPATIDFDKLRTLFVYDEYDNKIRFTDIFLKQKTIVIFLRHFLDFITVEYVEDLGIIPVEYLQEVDVRLVVIGPAPTKFIKPFKKLTKYHMPLYCDPDRQIYKALGLHEKIAGGSLDESKHIKSGALLGVLSSVWRAMRYQEYQGDPKQQGGSFILGPGEQVHFQHLDESCTAHMNINDLLIEAGVQPVSFPNDQRVVTI